MTKENFLKGIKSLVVFFYEGVPDENGLEQYYEILRNIPDEIWKLIVKKIILTRESRCFPRPAEIVRIYKQRGLIEDEIRERAFRAYEDAVKMAQLAGQYRNVQFDDKVIHKVILAGWGSWEAFVLSDEDPKWEEKRFVELYMRCFTDKDKDEIKYLAGNCSNEEIITQKKVLKQAIKQLERGEQ